MTPIETIIYGMCIAYLSLIGYAVYAMCRKDGNKIDQDQDEEDFTI